MKKLKASPTGTRQQATRQAGSHSGGKDRAQSSTRSRRSKSPKSAPPLRDAADWLQLNAELEQRVAERTAGLELANRQLEELNIQLEREIAERQRAETARRASEEKYSLLFREGAIPAALSKLPENTFVDVNEAFEKLFGYTKAEVIGKTSLELGIAKPAEHAATVAEVKQHGLHHDAEKHFWTKSGEARIMLINVAALELTGQRYALTTVQDITERKRAEQLILQLNQDLEQRAQDLELANEELSVTIEELRVANEDLQQEVVERKRADESLHVSEERFRFVLANSPVVVANVDRELRYTWVYNPASGFQPEDLIGKQVGSAADRADREKMFALLQNVISDGTSAQWESASWTSAGTKTFESHAEPLRDAQGEITGVALLSVDITERKRAEDEIRRLHQALQRHAQDLENANEELEVSNEELRVANEDLQRQVAVREQAEQALRRHSELLQLSFDAIIVWRLDGAIESWNRGAAELYGFTEAEALGRTTHALLQTRHPVPWHEIEAELRSKGTWEGELRHRTKDGREVIVSARHQIVRGADGVERVLETNRDITERKRAEDALRESEERFFKAFVKSPVPMTISLAQEGRWVDVNDAYTRLVEYSREELVGHTSAELNIIDPAERARLAQIVLKQGSAHGAEVNLRTKSGKQVTVLDYIETITLNGREHSVVTVIDITERKNAEEAMRESEKQLTADLDAMTRLHKLGTLFAQDGNLESVLGEIVDAAIAISGADFGNIQLLDAETSDLKIAAHRGFPDWWIQFWNQVSKGQGACGTALARGERVIVEDVASSPIFVGTPALDIQLKAGVRAVQSTPLLSRAGKPLGMFSTHYKAPHQPDERALRLLDLLARQAADIVERAQTEAALRGSEEQYRGLFEHMVEGYAYCRMIFENGRPQDFIYLSVNAAFETLTGLKEVTGKRVSEVIPGIREADPELFNIYARVASSGTPEKFEMYVTAMQMWFSISVYSPAKEHFVAVFDVITERKRAEEALRQRTDELQAIMEAVPTAIFITRDPDARTITGNRAARAMVELPSGANISKSAPVPERPTGWQEMRHGVAIAPEDLPLQQAAHGKEVRDYEMDLVFRDRTVKSVLGNATPLRDEHGHPQGSIAVLMDVTERKQVEASLQAALHRIQTLNEDLEQRAGELEIANEELEQLATSLALDLRSPLVSLRSLSRLISQDYGPGLAPQAQKLFHLIEANAEEMEQITQGLQQLTRVIRQPLRNQEVSPEEIVRAALTELRPACEGRQVDITIGHLPTCRADPLLLKHVWVNLLSNALKFTRPRDQARVEIGARSEGARTAYFVKDNGVGFDMSYAGTIFRAFQRYHHAEEWGGAGVGLAIVESIVRRHGGRVWAEGVVDEGATFYFTLVE